MSKQVFDYLARFRGPAEKSETKKIISGRTGSAEEFDEFLASWINHTNTKVTASFITDLLTGADEGYPQEQAALFQTILEKDPVIAAHIQTRIFAVLACDWSVNSTGKNPDSVSAKEKAAALSGVLKKAGLYKLMKHLLDAIVTGYSGSAVIWAEGGSSIEGFRHVHPANWIFDLAGNPALLSMDGSVRPLAGYHPRQFIFHTQQLKPGMPSRGGLLRSLVWLYFFKHYALRDMSRYFERFGIPFVMAKISKDDFENDTIKGRILNSLSKMGSDGAGVVTRDSEIDVISTAGQSGSAAFHEWFNYIDNAYALLILGQLATSKEASGLSKGQIQENVRHDLLEADCRGLMETINNQLLSPLEEFKYGGSGECEFVLSFEPREDLKEKAEIVKLLSESGFVIDGKYIEKTFKMPLKKNIPEKL